MTWKQYENYKKHGKKCFKAPWVYDFWDSVDLTKEAYTKMQKADIIATIIIAAYCVFWGILFGLTWSM